MNQRSSAGKLPASFRDDLQGVLAELKLGEVISYGDIAARAGYPNTARAAGSALANCPETLPWWRVVYSDGQLPPCNPSLQAALLAEEGVALKGFRVIAAPWGRFAKAANP